MAPAAVLEHDVGEGAADVGGERAAGAWLIVSNILQASP
jgi:hypothetical protein